MYCCPEIGIQFLWVFPWLDFQIWLAKLYRFAEWGCQWSDGASTYQLWGTQLIDTWEYIFFKNKKKVMINLQWVEVSTCRPDTTVWRPSNWLDKWRESCDCRVSASLSGGDLSCSLRHTRSPNRWHSPRPTLWCMSWCSWTVWETDIEGGMIWIQISAVWGGELSGWGNSKPRECRKSKMVFVPWSCWDTL